MVLALFDSAKQNLFSPLFVATPTRGDSFLTDPNRDIFRYA